MFASDYRRIAREKIAGCWGVSIGVGLLAGLLGGAIAGGNFSFNWNLDENFIRNLSPAMLAFVVKLMAFGSLMGLVQFVIGGALRQGYARFLLDQQDGRELKVKTLFSQFHRFGAGFLLALLENLFIVLWTMLFIIPGIVAAYRYAMAPFILLEHPDMTASEAIRASKELMHGHKGQLFCLHLSFIGWSFLCICTLGIGYLWLRPYTEAANAAFYREISAAK